MKVAKNILLGATLLSGALPAFAESATANLNFVLTEARCVPEYENGKPIGYRCFQIVPGSIYEKVGLQDNDVIVGIDGEPANDAAKLLEKFTAVRGKKADHLSLQVVRQGKEIKLAYEAEKPKKAAPAVQKKQVKK